MKAPQTTRGEGTRASFSFARAAACLAGERLEPIENMTRHPGRSSSLLLLLAAGLLAGCARTSAIKPSPEAGAGREARHTHELLHSVLWMQSAAEYKAACHQAYRTALDLLPGALSDPGWTAAREQTANTTDLPPAVILDIDETVLDNSPYETQLIRNETEYEASTWDQWCQEARAEATPGAVQFCREAHRQGVTIFYVTNRRDHLREATKRNLERLDFPLEKGRETVLTRTDVSDKGPRRARVAAEFRVLLLVGDQLGDFVSGTERMPRLDRARLVESSDQWGRKWIMLPNPAYGDWEAALYGYDHEVGDSEKLRRKYEALQN